MTAEAVTRSRELEDLTLFGTLRDRGLAAELARCADEAGGVERLFLGREAREVAMAVCELVRGGRPASEDAVRLVVGDEAVRAYLAYLADSFHTVAPAAIALEELVGLAARRRLAEAAERLQSGLAGSDGELLQALAFAQRALARDGRPRLRVLPAAAVRPELPEFLWPGRIVAGRLNLVIGDPGLGKSLLTVDVAARLSRGAEWPDGGRAPLANSLVVTAEDGVADTVRARLEVAGADLERVLVADLAACGLPTLADQADLEALERAVREHGVALLVLDPLDAFVRGVDSHKAAEVRSVLAPLGALAERTGAAVLGLLHLNKTVGGGQPIYRARGSLDFAAAARSVLCVARDPEDEGRRLLLPVKSNLSEPPEGLGFRILGAPLTVAGRTASIAHLHWDGLPVTVDARAALASEGDDEEQRGARAEAMEFLREVLADGPVPAREVWKEAEELGICRNTLKNAKRDLGVVAEKRGFRDGWLWRLPEGASPKLLGPLASSASSSLQPSLATTKGPRGQEDYDWPLRADDPDDVVVDGSGGAAP